MMKKVYLIGCTKSKQSYECCAEEMYKTSSLFNYSLNYALKHVTDKDNQIFILSAKHHLLRLSKMIYPYEQTLKTMNKQEKNEWGYIVFKQLDILFDINDTEFIFLAGNDYIEPLANYLIKWSNPVPKDKRELGKRLNWLKLQVYNETKSNLRSTLNKTKIHSTENIKVIPANKLRNKDEMMQISKTEPGWYKWWAPKETLKIILNSEYLEDNYFDSIMPFLTSKYIDNKQYYYIYAGVAINESIQRRIDWHINQKHTITSVQSGFLSTFRQSISSLAARTQLDEETTNKILDTLYVEVHTVNHIIKSNFAKLELLAIEENEINTHVLPLNIKGNKNEILTNYLQDLKKLRKISKTQ